MMIKNKIHKGDTVEVITGRSEDKGKRGEVIKVNPEENTVIVQGVNIHTKHQKQVQSQGRTVNPGILKLEGPISISNVMLVCPKCNKPTRVGLRREADVVQRVCKKCDSLVDA
jgi:large subunit ribosomal protein L24